MCVRACVCVGWSLGEHGEWSKYSVYEHPTHVPLIVHVPCHRAGHMTCKHHQSPFKLLNVFDESSRSTSSHTDDAATAQIVVRNPVELVDIFPSLADLALLPAIKQCSLQSATDILCTEGQSFAALLRGGPTHSADSKPVANVSTHKTAAFSQYPRPSLEPRADSDQPKLADIRWMGYSVRTAVYRYTEWIRFNRSCFCPDWDHVHARELYMLHADPREDFNVANDETFVHVQNEAAAVLHAGWRPLAS